MLLVGTVCSPIRFASHSCSSAKHNPNKGNGERTTENDTEFIRDGNAGVLNALEF